MSRHELLWKNLKRHQGAVQPQPRLLIVCQGTVTEPCYLNDWTRHLKIQRGLVTIEGSDGDPKGVVELALQLKREAERQASRSGDPNLAYDQVWVVCDVDDHTRLPNARQQAAAHGIQLCVSNPCIELWFVLHFRDWRQYVETPQIQHECRTHLPSYDKRAPFDLLYPHHRTADQNARRLNHWHESRDTEGQNPSTSMHLLVDALKAQGKDQRITRYMNPQSRP